jgi:3-methyladenine DNA glycosylase/8-oxoguanine DNA glycosylase
MREGGYARYDGKTSTQILRNCESLRKDYGWSLKKLNKMAKDNEDLEKKLIAFYGVGPTTANIFLRELRPFWTKADPEPLPLVKKIASRYRINLKKHDRKSITFVRIEAGLIRLRRKLSVV